MLKREQLLQAASCRSHRLLSAGTLASLILYARYAGFSLQEHAQSIESVTSVTQGLDGHVHSKPVSGKCCWAEPYRLSCKPEELSCLQVCAFGNDAVFQIAPKRDREAPCDSDDCDPPGSTVRARALCTLVEPLRKRAIGLVA